MEANSYIVIGFVTFVLLVVVSSIMKKPLPALSATNVGIGTYKIIDIMSGPKNGPGSDTASIELFDVDTYEKSKYSVKLKGDLSVSLKVIDYTLDNHPVRQLFLNVGEIFSVVSISKDQERNLTFAKLKR